MVALRIVAASGLLLICAGPAFGVAGGGGIAGGCATGNGSVVCTAGDDPPPVPGKATPAPQACVTQLDTSKPWPSEVRNGELWYYKTWKCQHETTWRNTWSCASCDPAPVQPPPPSPDAVWNLLVAIAKQPKGRFAPPIEQGNGIAMIYGKRLYFRTDTATFATQQDTMNFPGGWNATGTLTPTGITFTAAGNGIARCVGPGYDGTTRAGRAAADAAGCYLPITQGPKSGTIASTLTIRWNISVTSNIPGVALQGTTTTIQAVPIPVHDVQPILTN